jgi:hypothetical protein
MIHAILDTPCGFILANTDGQGVMVLARPLPPEARDDGEALRAFIAQGGIYIVAFGELPSQLHALRVPLGWKGERITSDHVVARSEAIALVGEPLVTVCCTIANEFAERIFAAWQSDASSRDAALRAVLTRLPVGEA